MKNSSVYFGMLKTIEVSPLIGRIRISNPTPSNKYSITVECFEKRVAFHFVTDRRFKPGDWVQLSGTVRVDVAVRKKTGKPAERNTRYIHQPVDGSNQADWKFFELSTGKISKTAAPSISEVMHEAFNGLKRHLNSWEYNDNVESLERTAKALKQALSLIESDLNERRPMAVKALDFTF